MRFLKNKIFKAQEAQRKRLLASVNVSSITKSEDFVLENAEGPVESYMKDESHQDRELLNKDAATKNIAVNYARAIASFAISKLAVPYLQTRLENESLTLKEFLNFINREKKKMGGICSFRARLLVGETDSEKVVTFKRVFQWIAEVFIKYFSVNWIIHGRLSHKETYLKFRFKMLRRVQNPESFTYIKERKTKS